MRTVQHIAKVIQLRIVDTKVQSTKGESAVRGLDPRTEEAQVSRSYAQKCLMSQAPREHESGNNKTYSLFDVFAPRLDDGGTLNNESDASLPALFPTTTETIRISIRCFPEANRKISHPPPLITYHYATAAAVSRTISNGACRNASLYNAVYMK